MNNMMQQMLLNKIMSMPQAQNNPVLQNALGMLKNNDVKGLEQLANNLAQQQGTSVEQLKEKVRTLNIF